MEKHQNQSDFDLVKNFFFVKRNTVVLPHLKPVLFQEPQRKSSAFPFTLNEMFWNQH